MARPRFKHGQKVRWTRSTGELCIIQEGPFRTQGYDSPAYVVMVQGLKAKLISEDALEEAGHWNICQGKHRHVTTTRDCYREEGEFQVWVAE